MKTFENFNKPKDIIKEFKATTGDVDITCTLTLKWKSVEDIYVGKLSYNFPKPQSKLQLKLYIPTIEKLKKQAVDYCTEVAAEYKVDMKI